MTQSAKRKTAAAPDIDQVKDDILALARDLAVLIEEMKAVAVEESGDAVRESVDAIGSKARALYDRMAAQGEQSAKAVGREIEARPVLSLLIAFAVGFCVSRLISR
jgi:ElaB/YqjD/DUF883 family membrane-anchored ribosome-binding protein